jgi:hypothetical protein
LALRAKESRLGRPGALDIRLAIEEWQVVPR